MQQMSASTSMPKLTVGRIEPAASEIGIRAIRRIIVHASILKASQLRSGDVVALSEADSGKAKKVRILLCTLSRSHSLFDCAVTSLITSNYI